MIPNPPLKVLGKKIAFSTLVQYGGKVIQLVLGILTTKYISGFFSEADYGFYKKIIEFALFFSVAANLGIFANIVRSMSDEPQNGKIFINGLMLRIITALFFFATAVIVLFITGNNQLFIVGTTLFLGALFFDYITAVCDGMLQANYLMGRATFALILGRLINFGCVYFIVKNFSTLPFENTVLFFLAGTIVASLITALLSFYFVSRKITLVFQIDSKFIWKLLKISLPFGIINIINSLYFRFLPDYFSTQALTDAQFSTFSISFTIAQVLSLFSTFLMFSALPGLKQYIDQAHWQKAHHLYKKLMYLLLGSGVLLVGIGAPFGAQLIELLTDKKYFLPEFWFVLPMMLFLAAISYGYDLILITLFGLGKDAWLIKREFIALGTALIFLVGSIFIDSIPLKLFFIVAGAIIGESIMVILGSFKINQIFEQHKKNAQA